MTTVWSVAIRCAAWGEAISLGNRRGALHVWFAVASLGALPALATAQAATFSVRPSQPSYGPGQTLQLDATLSAPGAGPMSDVYVVIQLPDGTTSVSLRVGGAPVFGGMANLAALQPFVERLDLGSPLEVSRPLFNYTFTGSEPPGRYVVYAAVVRAGGLRDGRIDAGDVLSFDTSTFTLTGRDGPLTVRITDGVPLLMRVGESQQLVAEVRDGRGPRVMPIAWRSSHPERIAVDATGRMTALVDNGSAAITAEANGVASAPFLVAVTTAAPGVRVVTDSNVVGVPVETNPSAPRSLLNTYKVVLRDVSPAPTVGSLLVNAGSQPVAGRVVAVAPASGGLEVTMALVPIRELFPSLVIDEKLDLSAVEPRISPRAAAAYDVRSDGSALTFTPKTVAVRHPLAAQAAGLDDEPEFNLGPLACKTSFTPFPVRMTLPPLITMSRTITLDLGYNEAKRVKRLVLEPSLTATVEASFGIEVAFEGSVSCEAELFELPLPVTGPLSALLGVTVPVGVEAAVAGKLVVANASVGYKGVGTVQGRFGQDCLQACAAVFDVTKDWQAEPVVDLPAVSDIRLEPEIGVFLKAGIDVGVSLFDSLQISVAELKAGAKVSGSWTSPSAQIAATGTTVTENYRSQYQGGFEMGAELGPSVGEAAALFGIDRLTAFASTTTIPLLSSPAPAADAPVTANRTTFVAGNTIEFKVRLSPATVTLFPGVTSSYNVSEILLMRDSGGFRVVARVTASPMQTTFTIPFVATDSGNVDQFSAFVVTRFVPLLPLEIGTAEGEDPIGPVPPFRFTRTSGIEIRTFHPDCPRQSIQGATNNTLTDACGSRVSTVTMTPPECPFPGSLNCTLPGTYTWTVTATSRGLGNGNARFDLSIEVLSDGDSVPISVSGPAVILGPGLPSAGVQSATATRAFDEFGRTFRFVGAPMVGTEDRPLSEVIRFTIGR